MDNLTTSAPNMPKMSFPTLEIRKNYYVITEQGQYHYFPIKVMDDKSERPIFVLEKAPPVLIEGIAIIGSRLFRVRIQDLMRGVIRKSREIKPANRVQTNGSDGTASNTNSSNATGSQGSGADAGRGSNESGVQRSVERSTPTAVEVEVGEAADLAWTEQIDSLLHHLSEKEGVEWEIAGPA